MRTGTKFPPMATNCTKSMRSFTFIFMINVFNMRNFMQVFSAKSFHVSFLKKAFGHHITCLISCKRLSVISFHDSFLKEPFHHLIKRFISFDFISFDHFIWLFHYMSHFLQKAFCNLIACPISYKKLPVISLHDSFPTKSF